MSIVSNIGDLRLNFENLESVPFNIRRYNDIAFNNKALK